MSVSAVIALLVGNLGVTVPQLIAVLTCFGSLVFMAKDLRLGIMFLFFANGIELMGLWAFKYDITIQLLVLFVSLALMAISLILSYKKTQIGQVY